jgi:hypothetical protein
MMAEQIQAGEVKEILDGIPKTMEYLRAEYGMTKMQAIMSLRNAWFAKQDLFKDFNYSEEEIEALEEDYYNGKIVRDSYDESYKKTGKAKFVDSSTD